MAILAVAFGIATIVSGGRVLFGSDAARAAAGQVVPFVLWFNFLAGFVYVGAGVGIARACRWAVVLSLGIAAATALVFLALGVHILAGGSFEQRTVAAMVLRLGVWIAIAVAVRPRPA
ncbi:MAG: hypothetical protein NDI82_04535 [Anaeromyxobacteraceae bacterium]|nr:hypothetical protein [Anaeromyxobacteraceae bacterium]